LIQRHYTVRERRKREQRGKTKERTGTPVNVDKMTVIVKEKEDVLNELLE
jgi:DNA-binding XRE family transcriptional regulator